MSHEINCPKCHTPNPVGSKFCNNCGNRLPLGTKILCPNCSTPNPRNRFYCDNCGKRLVEETLPKEDPKPTAKPSPQKFSLPERGPGPGHTMPLDPSRLPDWIKTGQLQLPPDPKSPSSDLPTLEEIAPLRKTTDELPTWLVDDLYASAPPFEPPKEITTDHFLELLKAGDSPEERAIPDELAQAASKAELPDWLSDVVPTGPLKRPSTPPPPVAPKPPAPPASTTGPAASTTGPAAEWHTELGPIRPGSPKSAANKPQIAGWGEDQIEDLPDWLSELGPAQTSQLPTPPAASKRSDEPPSGVLKTSEFAAQVLGGEELPDWLEELGPAQTSPLSPPPATTEQPISNIFRSDELAAQIRQTLRSDQIPDWLTELGPAQTAPLSSDQPSPATPEHDVMEWFTELGPMRPSPDAAEDLSDLPFLDTSEQADATGDLKFPDWLREFDPAPPKPPTETPRSTKPAPPTTAPAPTSPPKPAPPTTAPTPTSPPKPAPPTTDQETATELPDWLREIEATRSATLAADRPQPKAETAVPPTPSLKSTDWFGDPTAPPAATETTESAWQHDTDWLSELKPAAETTTAPPSEPDFADWLNDLEDEETAVAPIPPSPLPAVADTLPPAADLAPGELPDWLTALSPAHSTHLTPPPTGTAVPASSDLPPDFHDLFQLDETDADTLFPEWLTGPLSTAPFPTDAIPPAIPPAATPASSDNALADESLAAQDSAAHDGELDWLEAMGLLGEETTTTTTPIPPATAEPPALLAEDIPPAPADKPAPLPTARSTATPIFEDLFSFAAADTAVPAGESTDLLAELELAGEPSDGQLPDWFTQLGPPTAEKSSEPTPAKSQPPRSTDLAAGDVPDWLSRLRPSDEQEHISSLPGLKSKEPALADSPFADIPDELAGADLPEWLQAATTSTSTTTTDSSLGIRDIPDWLQPEMTDGAATILGKVEPDAASALSDLLAQLPPLPPPQQLVRAEIPDWLQALKPPELDTSGHTPADKTTGEATTGPLPIKPARQSLGSGPLAGLPDVINIEPIIAATHTPTAEALQFQVTPEQQQQMALLRQLSAGEVMAETAVSATPIHLSAAVRAGVVLLVLLAILVGLFGPTIWRPANIPGSNLNGVHTAIQAAAGQPVLLAFEYSPAMHAELDPAVALLLDELAANGSPILAVSQYAAGVGQAAPQVTAYTAPVRQLHQHPVTFIPGEAIGLRELGLCLRQPCQTMAGHTLTAEEAAALQEVALVLLFTGERNSLQNWIEQVGQAQHIPLVAVVTQALSPVLLPYQAAGQLAGSMVGLPETAVYTQSFHNGPTAALTRQLNAQVITQLVVALILLGGGLVGIFTRRPPQRRGQGKQKNS